MVTAGHHPTRSPPAANTVVTIHHPANIRRWPANMVSTPANGGIGVSKAWQMGGPMGQSQNLPPQHKNYDVAVEYLRPTD